MSLPHPHPHHNLILSISDNTPCFKCGHKLTMHRIYEFGGGCESHCYCRQFELETADVSFYYIRDDDESGISGPFLPPILYNNTEFYWRMINKPVSVIGIGRIIYIWIVRYPVLLQDEMLAFMTKHKLKAEDYSNKDIWETYNLLNQFI